MKENIMIETIFPTKIFRSKIDFTDDENESLKAFCQALMMQYMAENKISFREAGELENVPVFSDFNLKTYPFMTRLYNFFAVSFLELLQEYEPSAELEEVYDAMQVTMGKMPFMKRGDYKQIHCHRGNALVAVFYLDSVDNDMHGGKLILHDPSFNNTVRARTNPQHEIQTEKNSIVIIPAHVWHEVTPYFGNDERLTITMDIELVNIR